jgi:hypothetical protein
MLVKTVKGRDHSTRECRHVQVTHWPDRVEIEVCPGGPTIELPRDGEVVYLMNDRGDTVDSYRWQPAESAPGVRRVHG